MSSRVIFRTDGVFCRSTTGLLILLRSSSKASPVMTSSHTNTCFPNLHQSFQTELKCSRHHIMGAKSRRSWPVCLSRMHRSRIFCHVSIKVDSDLGLKIKYFKINVKGKSERCHSGIYVLFYCCRIWNH
jgi:hypothetical protein